MVKRFCFQAPHHDSLPTASAARAASALCRHHGNRCTMNSVLGNQRECRLREHRLLLRYLLRSLQSCRTPAALPATADSFTFTAGSSRSCGATTHAQMYTHSGTHDTHTHTHIKWQHEKAEMTLYSTNTTSSSQHNSEQPSQPIISPPPTCWGDHSSSPPHR